jgi:hypothetical protein
MNYIKANPFTSLGVATAAMTPDENNTPQKAADTDRGPRSKLQYYSGYGTSLPAPNMQGVEQTYNRPYYAAKGGVTRMATGGITSAPRNQQQLFAEYLQRVSSSGVAAPPPTNRYEWWKNSNDPAPAAPAPAETPEEYAERMRLNARGGGGGMSAEQRAEQAADNDKPQPMLNGLSRNEYFSLSPEEQNAVRAQADMDNPKTAAALNLVKLAASPVKFLYDKLAPAPAASEMQKYIDAADFESRILTRDRAYEAYGNSIEGVTASDAATAEAQRVQAEATEKARMERDIAAADPFSGATPTVDYSTGLYNDLSNRPDSSFPAGTNYTDKAFTRDRLGRVLSPDAPYTSGATTSSNTALVRQNAIAGSDMQRALNSQAKSTATPVASYPVGGESKLAGDIKDGTVKSGDSISFDGKQYKVNSEADGTVRLTENTQVGPALSLPTAQDAVAQTDAALTNYSPSELAGAAALNAAPFNAFDFGPTAGALEAEKARQTVEQKARIENMLGVDPYAKFDQFDFGPTALAAKAEQDAATQVQKDRIKALAEAPASLAPAQALMRTDVDTFAPVAYSAADEADRMFAAPDITSSVPGAISADPNADKKVEAYNIPSAAEFAAMIGSPLAQTAALNTGVVSDAGIGSTLAGYQGGYNPGYATPNMGNTGNIRGSFGIGGVWTNREGVPIRTGDGSLVMTGEGAAAMQRAVAESNEAANRTYGNSINSGPANDGRADPGGEGGTSYGSVAPGYTGGSEAAAGGLSTPYGFQHMAQGGMANPYDLGSYSDGGRLLRGPGDGVSDSIPATIGKGRPARLADGEFVIPARIVSEIGNGSTEAGARKLYAMMDRIQAGRKKSVGKGKVAVNSRADKYLPA